ncbi:Multifunctional CCA [Gossypium arboreum]|uniref:Multifunctional CCA n=1 Tax=Gossypium arboreum TaxID=29729 RepID=A0A0B0NXR5_GOSAR|nr:Multifunctional CCA [Gossypium arboreum]KHG17437.1 Multifunctional CCA [Gossypium arboreum]
MSQTWSYTSSHISVLMSCPRHGLTLTPLYVPMPCPRHDLKLTHLIADACPRHVLHWVTSRARYMSQTCLTLAIEIEANAMSQTWSYTSSHISILMSCPRHGLTLTPLYVPMPCPRHDLKLTHLIADACPRHVLH